MHYPRHRPYSFGLKQWQFVSNPETSSFSSGVFFPWVSFYAPFRGFEEFVSPTALAPRFGAAFFGGHPIRPILFIA